MKIKNIKKLLVKSIQKIYWILSNKFYFKIIKIKQKKITNAKIEHNI